MMLRRIIYWTVAIGVGTLPVGMVGLLRAQDQPAAKQAPAKKGIQPDLEHPILTIGSPAPDFSLPGVDGKVHKLAEYASAKVLAIVFECNHCPTSQLYEGRLEKLYAEYKPKGLTMVVINPNNPKSVTYDELGYTDMNDSLEEMKVRAKFRNHPYPYVYDGETQGVSTRFGVVATPHIYLFDKDRKLQYQGRIDDNQREDLVKSQDAKAALEAMFGGKPVPVQNTGAFGCTTKWLSKASGAERVEARNAALPVTIQPITADELKKLRANGTGKPVLFYFWSPSNTTSTTQFKPFIETYWMYHRERGFEMVTIATGDQAAALDFLKQQYASNQNKFFAGDRAALQAAWGASWPAGSAFTAVIGTDGKVLYQKAGLVNIVEPRRAILVSLPDTAGYIGQQAYWTAVTGKK